ncbi:hypothetical protein SOV92_06010 [Pectobacterium brasiliense]|uniref:Uncharacterized protein n=1 Tax=Pectobacterium brasiliense TaxID=180957 RepID=A0AAW9H844_9GAMM|nr:hypothetical protein [Pectobacterium brasiliense]MDY4377397.1 hypothetical protein [Pectobacterium brasiliense]
MSDIALNLEIEGDYIDSFIYMGVLFLVDFDFNIHSYQWSDICDSIYRRNGFNDKKNAESVISYLKCGKYLSNRKHTSIDTLINQDELSLLSSDKFHIGYYPSDIYIYSKKIYFAHEKGVYYTGLKHETGGVSDSKPSKIFDTRCFAISPNTLDRLALAAGREGVLTCDAGYFSNFRNNKDFKQISNKDSIDIEWIDNYLMINNVEKNITINKFKNQPRDEDFIHNKDMLLTILTENNKINNELIEAFKCDSGIPNKIKKEIKNIIVSLNPEEIIPKKNYVYSWTSGDFNFFLDNSSSVDVFKDNTFIETKSFNSYLNKSVDRVRTSGCGTYLESDNKLLSLHDNRLTMVDDDIVNWRVFPRAKKHCNHLHIIKEDRINIKVFDMRTEDPFSSYLKKHD